MIPVTKTFIPPIEEYSAVLNRAFKNGWLTNRGELVLELEQKISTKLKLTKSQILCLNNGTIPLQIALKLLGNGGEIITTPFSYVATTSAILWENCTPIFVDINPKTLTINDSLIEAAITDKTTCILATHVFGNPCNIDEIDRIAKKYNLKVIYDAAHCFGVEYKGKSVFEFGDISTCSFHATKVFHTGEGGAIFSSDKEIFDNIKLAHSFGHINEEYFSPGINGKMSELSAAMGLVNLNYFDQIIKKRKEVISFYNKKLNFNNFASFDLRDHVLWNFSYYPIVFENEEEMIVVKNRLELKGIFPRRYFFPSLNLLPFLLNKSEMKLSEKISKSVICLPLYYDLSESEIELIISTLNG
jgi:dTDP-4-amino-4,6-dideoxygalactose transaminase